MEILVSSLVATNKARVLPSKGVVILFPFAATTRMMVLDTSMSIMHQVKDSDLAIFEIGCAIHSLEQRVEHLVQQMEGCYTKALEAKKRNNKEIAILHLKRRNILKKEMERCLASLVNLDTSLHTIKRTTQDVELLKTYQLLNDSLKSIRQEAAELGQVEKIMNELEENTQELHDIHNEIHESITGNVLFQDEELEKELEELMMKGKESDCIKTKSGGKSSTMPESRSSLMTRTDEESIQASFDKKEQMERRVTSSSSSAVCG